MEYSQILLEMLERIKTLEGKVSVLEEQMKGGERGIGQEDLSSRQVSPKYRKLAEYLLEVDQVRVELSYPQIEGILGFSLPKTAENYPKAFWANAKDHSYASSWMEVGYKARVDEERKVVTFVKNL